MAETTLISIAKSAIEQLSSPALKEFLLLWNFKKELTKLDATVETIRCVLQDAQRRQLRDPLVQQWLDRLRAMMYDADDLFDEVAYRALRKKAMTGNALMKEVCLFSSKSNQLVFIFKTAHGGVKAIRKSLDDIARDMTQFNFMPRIEDHPARDNPLLFPDRRQTHSFVPEKDVIGRNQEREDIINLLLSGDHRGERTNHQDLFVIAIIGFGGLGKTTLAQLVYNDERVQSGFDLCLWACINYFSKLDEVLRAIITSISASSEHHGLRLEQLQKEFRETMGEKKYLLVLDDVWDEHAQNWLDLKTLLSCGKSGSKVLITTRKTGVAECLDASKPYYHLNVMSEESAWSLFVKMAFREGELAAEDPELKLLGQQIVRKCGYVPLALVLCGSMLRQRDREKKVWLRFLEKELPEVLSGNPDDNTMMGALMVSYNDLPAALKQCFALCSLFPKDYTFKKDELVQLWLAQGFLEPAHNLSLEEVGDACFFNLVDRCFFQEVQRQYIRNGCYEYTCKMHDLLHDLAGKVVGEESKCFIDEVPSGEGGRFSLRHISVYGEPDSTFDHSGLLSHSKTLRTLLCRLGQEFALGQQFCRNSLNTLLRQFKMLRVLELSYLAIDKLPNSIGELIHLRYLNLSGNHHLKSLPKSICKLYCLQILRLNDCRSLNELPSDIGKLVSLRHLVLKDCDKLKSMPSGLAALTSLVTLDRLIVHCCDGGLRYLESINNLSGGVRVEVPAEGWSNAVEDARKSNMLQKHKLMGFSIKWQDGGTGSTELDQAGAKAVLDELQLHVNVEYLRISRYGGDTLSSWVFSLENLKEIYFKEFPLEYLDDRVTFDLLLPHLEILEIKSMHYLKGWWKHAIRVGGDHQMSRLPRLPCVSKLVIEYCPELTESMPLFGGVEKLRLEEVDVKLVGELLTGNMNCSSSSSSECHYNSKLKELTLWDIQGLKYLPEGWLRHLTALQHLRISYWNELHWVSPQGLAHLTALKELSISSRRGMVDLFNKHDEKVENIGVGMPWKALQNLHVLKIPYLSRHFQNGLQYLTALEELEIGTWEQEDVAVDDHEEREGDDGMPWKGLERLRKLSIGFGGNTSRLPKGIRYLRSLQGLTIDRCKQLSLSWATIVNLKLHSLSFYYVDNVVNVDEMVEERVSSLVSLAIITCCEGEWIHDNIPWKLFPSLHYVNISHEQKLKSIPDGIQHLTSLKFLGITRGQEISAIPNWMVNLTSLQLLSIYPCSPELDKRCERETGEDWHLISHIRRILIAKSSQSTEHSNSA